MGRNAMNNTLSGILYAVAALNLFVGVFTLSRGPKKKPNRSFFIVTVLICSWAVCHGKEITSRSPESVLFWTHTTMIPGILLPFAWLKFAQSFRTEKSRFNSIQTSFHLLLILFFGFFLYRPQMIE